MRLTWHGNPFPFDPRVSTRVLTTHICMVITPSAHHRGLTATRLGFGCGRLPWPGEFRTNGGFGGLLHTVPIIYGQRKLGTPPADRGGRMPQRAVTRSLASGCFQAHRLRVSTSVFLNNTQQALGTLAVRLGCFPFESGRWRPPSVSPLYASSLLHSLAEVGTS